MSKEDTKYMRLVIAKAREGIQKGQSPFGACIVKNGKVLACEHNHVWANSDPTAHAEITAIREAAKNVKDLDDFKGATIYATCEPCPMCFTACHWAGIGRIVFGSRIGDSKDAGFEELVISNDEMKRLSKSSMEIDGDFLRDTTQELWDEWKEAQGKTY